MNEHRVPLPREKTVSNMYPLQELYEPEEQRATNQAMGSSNRRIKSSIGNFSKLVHVDLDIAEGDFNRLQ